MSYQYTFEAYPRLNEIIQHFATNVAVDIGMWSNLLGEIDAALKIASQPPAVKGEWVKAIDRLPKEYGPITWRWIDKKNAYSGYDKGGFVFGENGAHVALNVYHEIEWFDETESHTAAGEVPYMRKEDYEQIGININTGMPELEASFQSGYTAGHDAGYAKAKRETAAGEIRNAEEAASEWLEINGHKWSNNNDELGDNYGSFMAGWKAAKATAAGDGNTFFRETIEDILFKTGKHNQEQCSELADAILRDTKDAGDGKEDAEAFGEFLKDYQSTKYYPIESKAIYGWQLKSGGHIYTTTELYQLFKSQNK